MLSKEETQARVSVNPTAFFSQVRTEFAYILQRDSIDSIVYIAGFALTEITCAPAKLEFLSGLGYAIYVAAFDLDEHEANASDGRAGELDKKEMILRDPYRESSLNLVGLAHHESTGSIPQQPANNLSIHSKHSSSGNVGLMIESSPPPTPGRAAVPPPLSEAEAARMASRVNSLDDLAKMATLSLGNIETHVPAWEAVDNFSFPVASIPVKASTQENLTLDDFKDVRHLADGSNANVFSAMLRGEIVIIKMIKKEVQYDPVVLHEFDAEHGMLSRMAHPNIIRILGAGKTPRRFVVLEYLGGGTLSNVLNENKTRQSGFTKVFFRRPTFTYEMLLQRARDIAEALDYLHSRCHPGATIIHRDLKPDNVGFTSDGAVKLFDMGLCTCVKRRTEPNLAYEMTGNTGSLRYMAPEVALRKPYNEKVDVYSFGIMVWQMATDGVPFKGLSREQFMQEVVIGKRRPKLDTSWPAGFCNLLTACWHFDSMARPSFSTVVIDLNNLIGDGGKKKRGKLIGRPDADNTKDGKGVSSSSWF